MWVLHKCTQVQTENECLRALSISLSEKHPHNQTDIKIILVITYFVLNIRIGLTPLLYKANLSEMGTSEVTILVNIHWMGGIDLAKVTHQAREDRNCGTWRDFWCSKNV